MVDVVRASLVLEDVAMMCLVVEWIEQQLGQVTALATHPHTKVAILSYFFDSSITAYLPDPSLLMVGTCRHAHTHS